MEGSWSSEDDYEENESPSKRWKPLPENEDKDEMVPWPFADDPNDVQVTNHFQQQDPTSPPSSDDYFTSEDEEQTVSRDGGQYQNMAYFKGYLKVLRTPKLYRNSVQSWSRPLFALFLDLASSVYPGLSNVRTGRNREAKIEELNKIKKLTPPCEI